MSNESKSVQELNELLERGEISPEAYAEYTAADIALSSSAGSRPNVVLVHGAWAEGSCWNDVIERLQADGFDVTAPQFPLSSLAADVARLRQVLEFQDGPTLVVGHSYGGQIMTALGADAPNVVGLVYVAAFGLTRANRSASFCPKGR